MQRSLPKRNGVSPTEGHLPCRRIKRRGHSPAHGLEPHMAPSLHPASREVMEARFGHDFSHVRVHADARAAESARSFHARAYTVGSNVVFGRHLYPPRTAEGHQLLAHELTHVMENDRHPDRSRGQIKCAPDPKAQTQQQAPGTKATGPEKAPERPPDKFSWKFSDLLMYPLLVDIWQDLITKELTPEEQKEFRLKGTESAAYPTWIFAASLAASGLGGEKAGEDIGSFLETWYKYTEAMEAITPTDDVILDGFSRLVGLRIDDYLSSDLFMLRLKSRIANVVSMGLVALGTWSLIQGVKEPSEETGELTPSEWSKHIGLAKWVVGKIFKEQLKAPGFFDIGPLELKTHPAFAAKPFAGAAPPSGLTAEGSEGLGEAGSQLKLGLSLNLAKFIMPHIHEGLSKKDIGDPQKYRGWQGSLWFTYEDLDPTRTMLQAGKLPESKMRGGTIFGGGGHLGLLEAGATYRPTDDQGRQLTSWFLKGGYGYSGTSGQFVKKIGFTATYLDWKETDLRAPGRETGVPAPGWAMRMTPFAAIETGERHKFGAAAALSFVTGSGKAFDVSGFRGDLSYTYMGDKAPGKLPAFKIDLSGSLHRLDWWNPDSPLMWGIQGRVSAGPFFGGASVMTGAGNIAEKRAELIGDPAKVRVPTAVIFNGGFMF